MKNVKLREKEDKESTQFCAFVLGRNDHYLVYTHHGEQTDMYSSFLSSPSSLFRHHSVGNSRTCCLYHKLLPGKIKRKCSIFFKNFFFC